MSDSSWTLFVNGTFGVGKSTVLDQIGDLLAAAEVPFSLMDVDWFHRSWPSPATDPNNTALEARNLAAVWQQYRGAGPRQLVACGILADTEDRERYTRAFDQPVRSVRLEASPALVEMRLQTRYPSSRPAALVWHLDRHVRLAQSLRAADLDELVVTTDRITPYEAAVQVVEHFSLVAS